MPMAVQFIIDYRSPYCYLANTQMKALGTPIEYEPVDILAVMKTVNNQPSPMCPSKARYAGMDAARWAKHYGVPFSPNKAFLDAMRQQHFEGELLTRAGLAAQQMGVFEQVSSALFEAVWASTEDLVTEKGRSDFVSGRSIPTELWDVADSPEVGERLIVNNQRAVERGVFGVPTFFVDGEIFFGNDRLAFVKATLDLKR
jgi:2-hydroxychromene-2-carboxylate isomerase